jgi:hypothetical protein
MRPAESPEDDANRSADLTTGCELLPAAPDPPGTNTMAATSTTRPTTSVAHPCRLRSPIGRLPHLIPPKLGHTSLGSQVDDL